MDLKGEVKKLVSDIDYVSSPGLKYKFIFSYMCIAKKIHR